MKNSFLALFLGVLLTGMTPAQTPSKSTADQPNKITMAVVEFTPGPNAAGMTAEAKRQLQASIAFALYKSKQFDVVDVRHTRDASKANLEAVNGSSTAAAVRVGKQLGVSYVLTGNVVEYNTKGSATLTTRLVEVATGQVRHAGEKSQQSTSPMRSDGDQEMMTKVLKPIIEHLAATLAAVKY